MGIYHWLIGRLSTLLKNSADKLYNLHIVTVIHNRSITVPLVYNGLMSIRTLNNHSSQLIISLQ